MSGRSIARIPLRGIPVAGRDSAVVACVGTPNTGKSTLFNLLTGLRQKTANYPGVTVERHEGTLCWSGRSIRLIDLPGTYSLTPASLDERVATDVLLGRIDGLPPLDGIVAVIDATRLSQGLYLVRQLLDLELPIVVALTMSDVAGARGVDIDVAALRELLGGIPVHPLNGTTGEGLDPLRDAIVEIDEARSTLDRTWPALAEAADRVAAAAAGRLSRAAIERGLLDHGTDFATDLREQLEGPGQGAFDNALTELFEGQPPQAVEARYGHSWARKRTLQVQQRAPAIERWRHRLGRMMNRPVPATVVFLAVMMLVFQAVFAWATPLMDGIDAAMSAAAEGVRSIVPTGLVASLLADGVVAGVGSVLIFLPQIMILFAFIIMLEDTGFLARSAFLVDRAMRGLGLSGQSVIPMLSSFACAVPAVMAARTIPTRRERLATILAAPFMTCSARLPIYALLISAFVPQEQVGWFNLQGLVLFALYLLGILGGSLTAIVISRLALRGARSGFAMSLPSFRMPNWRTVLLQLLDRGRIFLRRAGTVIFTVSVLVWALAYFPRSEPPASPTGLSSAASISEETIAARQLGNSFLGRAGRLVEPIFEPLGWDWRVSAAVIAGFPAREVVVAVLGTIYAVGEEPDEERLADRLRSARWPDGRAIFTLPMVLGMLVFYALCLQCAATIAVIKRETNSWRWPLFAWAYMTGLAYLGALVVFQVGTALSG